MKKWMLCCMVILWSFHMKAQDIPRWKIAKLEEYMLDQSMPVKVINFWATFCKPCVAEIPHFIRTVNRYRMDSVSLLLVSLDLPSHYPGKIASFAKKQKFTTSIAWLDETNADIFCPKIDQSWSGSIPATIFINTRTGYRRFFEDELSEVQFEEEVKKAISGMK